MMMMEEEGTLCYRYCYFLVSMRKVLYDDSDAESDDLLVLLFLTVDDYCSWCCSIVEEVIPVDDVLMIYDTLLMFCSMIPFIVDTIVDIVGIYSSTILLKAVHCDWWYRDVDADTCYQCRSVWSEGTTGPVNDSSRVVLLPVVTESDVVLLPLLRYERWWRSICLLFVVPCCCCR